MLLISTQTTLAIFSALLFLEATEIILFIGFFTGQHGNDSRPAVTSASSPRSSPGTPRRPV